MPSIILSGRTEDFQNTFEKTVTDEQVTYENASAEEKITIKRNLKNKLKGEVKKKFIVGHKYELRDTKSIKKDKKIFILKKFVYSVENRRTNILVMKQISGYNNTASCLSKHDCALLHLKYEPGLQVWPMELKWRHIKDDK